MPRTATLSSLRDQVRKRADVENSTARFPDAELNTYINQSWTELYDLIIESGGESYLNSTQISTSNGTDTYSLPADFYKVRGVDVDVGGPGPLPMRQFSFEERNFYLYNSGWQYGRPVRYRLYGANIKFIPKPSGVYTVTVWYYPTPTSMVSDSDTIDGVSGWEEYVVIDAAVKVLTKDDRDASLLVGAHGAVRQRIVDMAMNRNAGEPERVDDVEVPNLGFWWR